MSSRENPAGIDLIKRGECPRKARSALACMFCPYGHMLECHYPLECEEARCSHFTAQEDEGEAALGVDAGIRDSTDSGMVI
jgi:hypothetical protein